MLYLTYVPGLPLSEFVDYFWLFDGGQTPRKERIVPSGTTELVINLRDDEIRIHDRAQSKQDKRFSGAVLSGTYSSILVVDAMQHESMLGVHFKPGGAFPFLGTLASELTDAHADLADLWGRSASDLRSRLCDVGTPWHSDHGRGPHGPTVSLSQRPRRGGDCFERIWPLRHRSFGARCRARGWFMPAAVQKGVRCSSWPHSESVLPHLRFQRVRTLADQIEKPDWAQIASICGYFDQSHLINDFQEFSGFSPTVYLRRLRQNQQDGRLKSHQVPLPG